ncbi:hypothetical protein M3J09_009330 [Ascochyta lentis]
MSTSSRMNEMSTSIVSCLTLAGVFSCLQPMFSVVASVDVYKP